MIRRREFITLLGGAAAAWPVAAWGQPRAMPVIGFLSGSSPDAYVSRLAGFQQGLMEAGFVEGGNVAIEYRWAEGHYDRLPSLAADLVRRQVAVIFASGGAVSGLAAKTASAMIPIVFANGGDPVKDGLVTSFSQPGGNVTGVSFFSNAMEAKRLSLLHELAPTATVVLVLVNPKNTDSGRQLRDVQAAADTLGMQVAVLRASTEGEIGAAFANFAQQRVGALLVLADAFLSSRLNQLVALADTHSIPAIYFQREFAAAGGLMSYGASNSDEFRQAANYVGKILKGAKPGDLPVSQPVKFELVINLKTARALGITVPSALLARADEVIE
jgi:putative ABC transport system substrate-binding protein